MPSNKKFGWTFSFIFTAFTIFSYFKFAIPIYIFFGFLSIFWGVISHFAPEKLKILNIAWFRFGFILSAISQPIFLGIIFYILLTPVAIVTRFFGRDILLVKSRRIKSYWIARSHGTSQVTDFKNQF